MVYLIKGKVKVALVIGGVYFVFNWVCDGIGTWVVEVIYWGPL